MNAHCNYIRSAISSHVTVLSALPLSLLSLLYNHICMHPATYSWCCRDDCYGDEVPRGDSLPSAIALILLLHMGLRDCRLGTSQFTHLRAILLEVNSRPGIHISGLELTSRLPSIELTSRSFKATYPKLRSN